jgi:membrane-bound lytic murein transglycosylase D
MFERRCCHDNTRTKLASAGLVAGLALLHPEWCWPDSRDQQAENKPTAPISGSPSASNALHRELKVLLTDFGVPAHNIPIDFEGKVRHWVHLYQTRDRDEMKRVLETRRRDFELVRQQLASINLPPDLAFVTLVESHFQAGMRSPDDNAGLWQFTRDTATRNGLKVNAKIDERLDPRKSTEAACRYLLRLRQQLGQDSSLMLVLAAYNMGPGRLKQRTRQIEDLSKRRDFWYLYREHVLPAITRTHLARLTAAILIGRYPQIFGFTTATPSNLETASSAPAP